MPRTTLFALTTVVLGCLLLAACGPSSPSFRGNALDSPTAAPDFALTDQHGLPFRLSEQQGRVMLLFFGYASCPDVCPTTLGIWKRVHADLGVDVERVRFVFVTVDPERDTRERMREHLALFSPDFVGLTGTLEELEPIYQAYGVFREKEMLEDSDLGYQVVHTSSAYVIDTKGYWRLRHLFGTPAEDIVHDVQQLLKFGVWTKWQMPPYVGVFMPQNGPKTTICGFCPNSSQVKGGGKCDGQKRIGGLGAGWGSDSLRAAKPVRLTDRGSGRLVATGCGDGGDAVR